jgi:hypothetical protein
VSDESRDRPYDPRYRRRSHRDLKPGESPLTYYGGWQHFWLSGVKGQVRGLNARLDRRPFAYPLVGLALGVLLVGAGLVYSQQAVSEYVWTSYIANPAGEGLAGARLAPPIMIGIGIVLLLLSFGGLVSALAVRAVERRGKESDGNEDSHNR